MTHGGLLGRVVERAVAEILLNAVDVDGAVNLAAAALALAQVRADASRDGGEGIAFPVSFGGLVDAAHLHEAVVAADVAMQGERTG